MAYEENRSVAVADWLSNTASKGTLSPPVLPSSPEAENVAAPQHEESSDVTAESASERRSSRPRRDERERRRSNGTRRGGGSTYRPNYGLAPETRRDSDHQHRGCSPRHETNRQPHGTSYDVRRQLNPGGNPNIDYEWDRRP